MELGMEDLSWILDMEISQIQALQDGLELDQNEIESLGKGKGKEVMYAETHQQQDSHSHLVLADNLDIQNVASSFYEQVNAEESRMVSADENETETQMNQSPKGDADKDDPSKVRRKLAKRESAHRTRLRKRQHGLELEGEVKALEIEVAIAPTRIKYFDRRNAFLKRQCSMIEQRISVSTNQLQSERAKYESLMWQREMLTQLYLLQRQRQRRLQKSSVAAPGPNPDQLLPANWNQAGDGQPGKLMGPMVNMNLSQAGPQRLIQQPHYTNKQLAEFQQIGNVNY